MYPSPSTDGKRLFALGQELRGELMRYESKPDRFASFLSGISAWGLDFSLDGKWVVYITYPQGELWRSRVDGSERQQLVKNSLEVYLPHFSPDGKTVALMGRKPRENWKIYLLPADGGVPKPLDEGSAKEFDPTWSPDGNAIAFGGQYGDHDAGIRIVDLKTRKVSELPDSKGLFSPRGGRPTAAISQL